MVLIESKSGHLEWATARVAAESLPQEALDRLPSLWQELAAAETARDSQ